MIRKPGSSNYAGRNTFSFQGNGYRGYAGPGYRGYYGPGYRPGWGYGVHPYWWGYYAGWGIWPWGYYAYGYYPYWGAPPVSQAPDAYNTPKTDSLSLFLGGSITSQGLLPSGSFSYDGKRWGINVQGIGLMSPATSSNPSQYVPLLSTHLAFSLVSNPHFRWRVEAGASSAFTPSATYIGPDFGTSAQLAIVGPLGVQAAVHYTPVPAKIADLDAGLTLSFGGIGVKGGWRVVRFDDRGTQGADQGALSTFSGPSVSVGFMY